MARLVDPNKKVTKPEAKLELPKVAIPLYDLTIPSSGEVIKVRPFTVAEEKLLLMASESKDTRIVLDTVTQVINNCIVSGTVDINKLPFFDIDYIFIFLRAKSIGESVELKLICNNQVEGDICGNAIVADLNISNAELYTDDSPDADIKLTDELSIKMKYPSYTIIKSLEDDKTPIDKKTNLIINSIDYIYDKKTRYTTKDFTKGELKKYIEGLTEEHYKKLEKFVDNFPTFVTKFDVTCSKCGYHHNVRYTDFEPFFT